MHIVDNFQDNSYEDNYFNLNAALDTIGGAVGQIAQAKAAGQAITAQQNQMLLQAQQAQALLQQQQQGQNSLGLGGKTTIIILAVVAVVVIVMVFKMTK